MYFHGPNPNPYSQFLAKKKKELPLRSGKK